MSQSPSETRNEFALGVTCMARNCLSAVELVRSGKWTLEDMETWLNAVIISDADYARKIYDLPRSS